MKAVSLVDRRFASLKGHIIMFTAGVTQNVPREIADELRSQGFAVEDGFVEDEVKPAPVAETKPTVEFDQEKFEAAVLEVLERNNPDELSETGKPKAKAVEAITGFPVAAIKITTFLNNR
jgi:hypothetical protein